MIPAVAYAAKSTDDKHGSIPTQLADADVLAEHNDLIIKARFSDEAKSAWKGNRGADLERAMAECERLKAEHGSCALIVQHSDRLARGDGKQAKHLIEYALWALKAGITIRSVQDPQTFGDLLYTVVTGQRNHEDSARKSQAVRDGKKRQLARGDHLGGPVCDGYVIAPEHDSTGRVVSRKFALDPDRAPLVRSIFTSAAEGLPDAVIARKLNAEGHRTRHGRPFTRRAIQNTVTNPWYAGRVAYKRGTTDEQVVDGRHPRLIEPQQWDAIQRTRAKRDKADPEDKVVGRPAQNHALARLAVCGRCRERLYARTSSYRRHDGTRARSYVCHAYLFSTGTCDARPINAEVVDRAVIDGLDTLLVDFEAWRHRIEDGHRSEHDRLAAEVGRAQADRDHQERKATATAKRWSEFLLEDPAKADLVLPIVESERQALLEAERRLQASEDALAEVPAEVPVDAMLDFANALQDAVRGRVDKTGSMQEVNQALRELFKAFVVSESPGTGLFNGILVEPWLREGAVGPPADPELGWDWPKLINAHDAAPPLRTLTPRDPQDPEGNGAPLHA